MPLQSFLTNCYKYKRKLAQIRNYGIKTNTTELKVLFFGTDTFSLSSLKVLHKHISNDGDLGVVTSFKNPANCIRVYAEQHKLTLYKWPVRSDDCRLYDLGVVVSFGHLIPTNIIEAFPGGMINVHASLLPRWRGAAPIIYALMNGDQNTGVSIMRVEPKHFDIGNVFAQSSIAIKRNTFLPELHKQLSEAGADLLIEVIKGYPQSFENTRKQDETKATYAPKITPSIAAIEWCSMSADEVYTRYRALYGFKNLTTTFLHKTIQLLKISPSMNSLLPSNLIIKEGGMVYYKERKCLLVKCCQQTYIEIHRLRLEGKKAMSAEEFNNGYLKKMKRSEILFQSNKSLVYL